MATLRVGQEFIGQLREYANELAGKVVISIGQAGVEHIRQRTRRGYDRRGTNFIPYSERYKKAGQPVDLHDTGAMLGNLQVLEGGRSTVDTGLGGGQIRGPVRGQTQSIRDVNVQIGFTDPDQAIKAYAHVSGDYGRGPKKVRDFMGLEDLWVQEEVDRVVRGLTPKFTDEVIQVRAL